MIPNYVEYLRYDSDTGDLYWLKNTNPRGPSKVGLVAGAPNTFGHVLIGLHGIREYAHRIAWFLTYGYMPERLDHINGKPWDNRLCNLRECTHAQNIAAAHSKALGYEIHGAKYRVRIAVNDVRHELGSFDSPEEATAAYQAARERYLGDFA